MKTLINRLMNSAVYAPADDTGSAAPAAGEDAPLLSGEVKATAAVEPKSAEDTLYGDDGKAAEEKANKAEDEKPAEGAAAEWKEYVPDPDKTADENAALKAEHDKAKPQEKDEAKDPADIVPEDGKYDIKLADGIQLDQGLLEKASPVMKEIGLTNGQASKLAGVLAETRKQEFDALNERNQQVIAGWQKEIRNDAVFGGDKLDTSLNNANRVIATFGDDDLRRDLTELGIGNHPGFFRLLARVGNALSDDKPVTSETPAASRQKDLAETLYGPDEG